MKIDYFTKMTISFIVLLLLIIGCETTHTSFQDPSRNPKCEDVKAFKVFQVLDKFVLANVCEDNNTEFCFGHVVRINKEKETIYYDDQVIKVKYNECAIYTGTFKYETNRGYKTVPIVKIINSRMPNTE